MINPKVLKMLKNTGLTYKEAGELADRFRKAFKSLPTAKQLAKRMYFNLNHWRNK
jgi:hypothetical protein